METTLALIIGVGLAASCGFRVFAPMLVAGLAARNGWLDPSESFAWIATTPALIAFSAATIVEAVAYYVPWLDNLLDTIASPLAVIAGILLSASMLGDVSPLMQWSFAIIAGGGAAATVQGGTVLTRLTSTTTTGGTANFLLTTLETAASLLFAILSILAPILSLIALLLLIAMMYYTGRTILRQLRQRWSSEEQTGSISH
ncbi:MAG: DUF4126 domain-containing protein [Planctomycetaceae bacterium]|nr:DUF4126 domain-containing protein [Planctomycetaceae bacterium]